MAIGKFFAPLNGQNYINQPYVDDIFDPLFNADVRNYYNSIYGNNPLGRVAGIASGYGQMWENALTGKKGILGPGMGILGTFGRSMDKADDFILGTLTEGVNALGQVTGGSNVAPTNPLRNIFVEDQDYQGTRLLASIGNAMSRLTGNPNVQLNEQDFTTLGDRILGTGIDLATDPGILGGSLARLNPTTPVGRVGSVLNDYDNLMANIAGNLTLPGGKAMVGKFIKKVQDVNTGLGAFKSGEFEDVKIKDNNPMDDMVYNAAEKSGLNPKDAEWSTYEDYFKSSDPTFKTSTELNAETDLNTLSYVTTYKKTGKSPYKVMVDSINTNINKPTKIKQDLTTIVNESSPKVASEVLATPITTEDSFSTGMIDNILQPLKVKYGLRSDMDIDSATSYLNKVASKSDKEYLIPMVNQLQRTFRYTQQGRSNIVSEHLVDPILKEADDLTKKHNPAVVERTIQKLTYARKRIIPKNDIISDYLRSPGVKSTVVPIRDLTFEKELRTTLKHNIQEINSHTSTPVFELIDRVTEKGNIELGYKPILSNTKIIKELKKLDTSKLNLQDIVFNKEKAISFTNEEQEIVEFLRRLGQTQRQYANRLGFKYEDDDYVHLLMENSEEAGEQALKHYEDLGLNKDQLDAMLAVGRDKNNKLINRGAFGTIDYSTGFMGSTAFAPGKYNYDLRAIARSAFTDSYMKNVDVQSCLAILDNPTFTLKNRFDSTEEVKQALFAGAGNENLTLATLKLNEDGQIIGFKRYNKFNDSEIEKAFKDQHCVMVPENIIGHLEDSFIKNNKVTPKIVSVLSQAYKTSILNNLAFPLGNFGDAFTKQSIELGRYFGDDAVTAAANTAKSMKDVVELNNLFDTEVMQDFRRFMSSNDAKQNEFFRKYTGEKDLANLTAGTIFSNPEKTRMFEKYVNDIMPDGRKRNLAIFFMDTCGDVDITIGKYRDQTKHVRFNKDLEDMNSMFANNSYADGGIADRILYGDKTKEHSFGFINNPFTKVTLGISEDYIEPMSRGATYFNWMYHKGYTLDDMLENIGYKGHIDKEAQKEFEKSINEAINSMYASNFNYESTSKFQKAFSKFVPFPTFFLKNIAFWLDVFDKNPQYIDNIVSVQEGLWSGKDTSRDEFTAEAKGRGAIPIGSNNSNLTGLVKPTPFNSMFGAFGAINDPIENIAFRTNPVLRPLTRHLQDAEDVKYRPYTTNQYEKNIKMGDPQFSNLAYMFHQLNPYDKYFNTYMRTPGKVAHNQWQLSDLFPSIFQPDFKK